MIYGKKEGDQAMDKINKLFILIIVLGFLASPVMAEEDIERKEKDKIETIKASAIIPLKVEGLEWKFKYYQEKALTLQLRAMIQLWNQVEFQEIQKIIRETDQEIKHLLLAK